MKYRLAKTADLFDQGWRAVENREYDEATKLGRRLERRRYTGAFEILALSHAGKGDLVLAIKVLEKGVRRGPTVWRLWQLLGNYRSDLKRYKQSFAAFRTALTCPAVDKSSVHLNWAVASNRANCPEDAIAHLKHVRAKPLNLRKGCEKVGALTLLREFAKASRLARLLIARNRNTQNAEPFLSAIHTNLAECIWRLRADGITALKHAWKAIALDQTNGRARWLIREIRNERSLHSCYLRVIVEGQWPWQLDGTPKKHGFMMPFEIVADSPAEALRFATEFEPPALRPKLRLSEFKRIEPRPKEPKGVYWVGGRGFYPIRRSFS